jgi:DNA polymerase IV (DinB-like DNA polymerase)
LRYFVGCAGWRLGAGGIGFYPQSLDSKDYLSHYSRVFDLVEVGLPAAYRFSLKRWAAETPEGFRFIVRMPRQVSEGGALGAFLEGLRDIEEKVLAIAVQTPQGIELADGRGWLEDVLDTCTYHGYSVLLDFSHPSWFQDLAYSMMRKAGASLYWSNCRCGPPQAVVTSDTICLRLAARDGWQAWVEKAMYEAAGDRRINTVAIVADSPSLANAALKLLGLPEKVFPGPLPSPAPVRAAKSKWAGRVVACVDLNAFYPSCEELREPSLRGRPHAVIMTDQPADRITKGVVSSCSYEARRFGVRSAMPLSRALSLCPDLVLRPVDIAYYGQVSDRVMGVVAAFADALEQASIDEAFLDCTTKMGQTCPEEYASQIKRTIREKCGLLASVGIAPSKSTAKIASDFKKPDGATVVYADRLQDFLAPLDVSRVSGIGPKTQQELKRLGIETIGQLAAYDVQKLSSRFGRNGLWMWQVANGIDDSPVEPREDHISVSTEHSLEVHARERDEVVTHLNCLVDEIYGRLARKGYHFRTVGVKLVRSDYTIESREVSFPSPKTGRESISSVIPQLAERFSYDVLAVRKVGLRVTNLVPTRNEAQRTLLDFVDG